MSKGTGEGGPGLGKTLVVGVLFMGLHGLLCALAGVGLSPMTGVILAFGLGLGIIVVGSGVFGPAMIMAGILAVASGGAAALYGPDWYVAATGAELRDARITDVLARPEVAVFHFKEARPRREWVGCLSRTTRSRDGGSSTASYFAAPILPEGWDLERPVMVWAVFDSRSEVEKGQSKGRRVGQQDGWDCGVRMGPGSREEWQDAARDAAERHGLQLHDEAVFLRWAESREGEVARRRTLVLGLAALMLVFWLVGYPVGLALFREDGDGSVSAA